MMDQPNVFTESWIHMDVDKDSEESKHWDRFFPQTIFYGNLKKGYKFTISYSHDTKEEKIDENMTIRSIITKTITVKVIKIKKNKPRLDIYVEKVQ